MKRYWEWMGKYWGCTVRYKGNIGDIWYVRRDIKMFCEISEIYENYLVCITSKDEVNFGECLPRDYPSRCLDFGIHFPLVFCSLHNIQSLSYKSRRSISLSVRSPRYFKYLGIMPSLHPKIFFLFVINGIFSLYI